MVQNSASIIFHQVSVKYMKKCGTKVLFHENISYTNQLLPLEAPLSVSLFPQQMNHSESRSPYTSQQSPCDSRIAGHGHDEQ